VDADARKRLGLAAAATTAAFTAWRDANVAAVLAGIGRQYLSTTSSTTKRLKTIRHRSVSERVFEDSMRPKLKLGGNVQRVCCPEGRN
jgi:hypothetical protein